MCPAVNVRKSSRIAEKAQSSTSFCAMQFVSDDPDTVAEAMSGENASHWRVAMQEEFRTLTENSTWELTDLPPDKKAIQSRWVFKSKLDEHNNVLKWKARLVAKEFSQRRLYRNFCSCGEIYINTVLIGTGC